MQAATRAGNYTRGEYVIRGRVRVLLLRLMSEPFLHRTTTRAQRNVRLLMLGGGLILIALAVAILWYSTASEPVVEEPQVSLHGIAVDEFLAEYDADPPYDPDETYFAEAGAPVSGETLNKIRREHLERFLAFEFRYVPDAADEVTLIPPPDDTDETDLEIYHAVQDAGEPPEMLYVPNGQSALDFVSASEYAAVVDALYTEVWFLTLLFHDQFTRPALYERFPDVVEQTAPHMPYDVPGVRTIYPNLRAAEAFFYAELFSRLDPGNAQAYWDRASDYADYGIYHGLYGLSDVEATHAMVAQYFTLLEQSTEGQALLEELSGMFE